MSLTAPTNIAPQHRPWRVSLWRWATLVSATLVLLFAWHFYTGQGGIWVRLGQPLFQNFHLSSLLSYSHIIDSVPLHKENLPTFKGVALLSGGSVSAEFYQTRVLYNYLASLLAPVTGMVMAFQLVNSLCWGLAVALSWRLAWHLSHGSERAAAFSALLTMFSLGWLIHLSDYSAHILADVTYGAGAVWLVESGVWCRRRRLSVHVAMGLGLAVASLAYNTGTMLLVAYGLLAWRHNAWKHLALAMVIGGTAQPLWAWVLDRLATHPAEMIESGYLLRSLLRWADLLQHDPLGFGHAFLRFIIEYQTVDMPLLGGLALLGVAFCRRWRPDADQPHDRRWLLLVLILVPFAAILPFRFSTTGTIAYTVLGVTPVLHGVVAVWLAGGPQDHPHASRWLAMAGLLAAQILWASSPLWGWTGPMLSYFYGGFDIAGAWWHVPHISSLTGQEPTPRLFGGTADLIAAGLAVRPQDPFTSGYNPLLGVVAKLFPTLYVGLLLHIVLPPTVSRARLAGWGGLAVVVLSGWVVTGRIAPPPLSVNIWSTQTLAAGQTLDYRLNPSADWQKRLRDLPAEARLSFFVGLSDGQAHISLWAGERRLELAPVQQAPAHGLVYELPPQTRQEMQQAGQAWRLQVSAQNLVTLRGWQRPDLVNRQISPALPVLPLLELRAYAPDGGLLWAGF